MIIYGGKSEVYIKGLMRSILIINMKAKSRQMTVTKCYSEDKTGRGLR